MIVETKVEEEGGELVAVVRLPQKTISSLQVSLDVMILHEAIDTTTDNAPDAWPPKPLPIPTRLLIDFLVVESD